MAYKEKASGIESAQQSSEEEKEKLLANLRRLAEKISAFINDTFGRELGKEFVTPEIKYEEGYPLSVLGKYEEANNTIVCFEGCFFIDKVLEALSHEMSHAIFSQLYNKDKASLDKLGWYERLHEGLAELTGMYIAQAISSKSEPNILKSASSKLEEILTDAKSNEQAFLSLSELFSDATTTDDPASLIVDIVKYGIYKAVSLTEIMSTYYRPTLGLIQVVIESYGKKSFPKILEEVLEDPGKFDPLKKNLEYRPIYYIDKNSEASTNVKKLIRIYISEAEEPHDGENQSSALNNLVDSEKSILKHMSTKQKRKELPLEGIKVLESARDEAAQISALAREMLKRIEELESSSKAHEMYNEGKKLLRM